MTFNYVSLFSGVGGFEQALDKLGGKCVFASEIDKFASKAYATLYGDDHLHGDVTKIDEKEVPNHDLLVGGFPDEAHRALVDAGISDSQRYKMAGNAVTVNVIEAIGERLLPLLTK